MKSRIAELVQYFVGRTPGVGRTRIVKFLYMVDHESRRYLGHPLTDLVYRWDNHGPYDPEIQRQIDQMRYQGYLKEEEFKRDYTWYKYTTTSNRLPCPLKKEEKAIVDHVVHRYADMKLDTLLEDVVYQTRPMLEATRRGQRLKMSLVDGELRVPGIELERMVVAFEELKAGGGRFLEDILAEV